VHTVRRDRHVPQDLLQPAQGCRRVAERAAQRRADLQLHGQDVSQQGIRLLQVALGSVRIKSKRGQREPLPIGRLLEGRIVCPGAPFVGGVLPADIDAPGVGRSHAEARGHPPDRLDRGIVTDVCLDQNLPQGALDLAGRRVGRDERVLRE